MEVLNLVIHQVKKEDASPSVLQLSKESIQIDNTAVNFVERLVRIYNKKTGRYHGLFSEDNEIYPFQDFLNNYVSNETEFIDFTNQSMRLLKKEIDTEPLARGGYLVFAHFQTGNTKYFLVVMLHDKESYIVDENLQIIDSFQLNIEELSMASKINCERWLAGETDNYLSFVRGKGRKDISAYFLKFVGCVDKITDVQQTKTLIVALNDHLREYNYSDEEKITFRERTFSYCDDQHRQGKEVEIRLLSEYLFNEEDEVDRFYSNTTSEEYGLHSNIQIHKNSLSALRYLRINMHDISLKVPTGSRHVIANEDDNTITITDVPINAIRKLLQ